MFFFADQFDFVLVAFNNFGRQLDFFRAVLIAVLFRMATGWLDNFADVDRATETTGFWVLVFLIGVSFADLDSVFFHNFQLRGSALARIGSIF